MAQAGIPVPQLWLHYFSTNTIPKSQCCNHRKDLENLYRNMARRQWAICEVVVARAFELRAAGDTEVRDALTERARQHAIFTLIDVAD
jgi:hypothetical protein